MAFSRSILSHILLCMATILVHPLVVKTANTQNCTTTPCGSCMPTNKTCTQTCSAPSCNMNCDATERCFQRCESNTGCNKITCNAKKYCDIGDGAGGGAKASEMKCSSENCHITCSKDNCNMECGGTSCNAVCEAQHCTVNCNAGTCSVGCYKGYCKANYGKGSSGDITCPKGHCDLVCQKGAQCVINSCGVNNTCTVKIGQPKSNHGSVSFIAFIGIAGGLFIALLFSA